MRSIAARLLVLLSVLVSFQQVLKGPQRWRLRFMLACFIIPTVALTSLSVTSLSVTSLNAVAIGPRWICARLSFFAAAAFQGRARRRIVAIPGSIDTRCHFIILWRLSSPLLSDLRQFLHGILERLPRLIAGLCWCRCLRRLPRWWLLLRLRRSLFFSPGNRRQRGVFCIAFILRQQAILRKLLQQLLQLLLHRRIRHRLIQLLLRDRIKIRRLDARWQLLL